MAKSFPKRFIEKNITFARDFNDWVFMHDDALDGVPRGSSIIFTSPEDPELSEANRDIARHNRNQKYVEAYKHGGGWKFKVLK